MLNCVHLLVYGLMVAEWRLWLVGADEGLWRAFRVKYGAASLG